LQAFLIAGRILKTKQSRVPLVRFFLKMSRLFQSNEWKQVSTHDSMPNGENIAIGFGSETANRSPGSRFG
jgi:hypothetical protein